MITVVGFALAAAVGALVRSSASRANQTVPYGTFTVNVVGAFALGLLADVDPPVATVAGVAGAGTLTTFSMLCVEAARLWSGGDRILAVGYVAASCAAGVAAAALGIAVAP
ncbi:fluoride efflux transporter FluC [Actinomarinicola tropica]|uniref:Fluoride-specific ion channel FluC n=1 Tax=Actinomarinicola tropica TaxID=2789776 RepID=A0A5Q2RDD1_9ACTN|nr:CrcB family protein [Actinomarinicola tropica]QGG93714.1 fluoride efflux transporter CrcB [Actinomarinicola tropica]